MYKSEHLAKENIRVVHKHIKNTQNHISLGNYKLKQQWSIAPHLLEPVNSKKKKKEKPKNPPADARDSISSPYPGKIPHATEQLSCIFPKTIQGSHEYQTCMSSISKTALKKCPNKNYHAIMHSSSTCNS